MRKEELNDCLKVFYAAVKQKDGEDFKVSSLRAIREIERYLKQPPINKPWSIVGDPAFETANKVLNAICRKKAREGKANPIVHKNSITKEQVEQLFPNQPTWGMSQTRSRTVVAHYLVLHHPVFW